MYLLIYTIHFNRSIHFHTGYYRKRFTFNVWRIVHYTVRTTRNVWYFLYWTTKLPIIPLHTFEIDVFLFHWIQQFSSYIIFNMIEIFADLYRCCHIFSQFIETQFSHLGYGLSWKFPLIVLYFRYSFICILVLKTSSEIPLSALLLILPVPNKAA